MLVQSFKVESYKGISNSGEVPIGRNFTVVVGQNNSGKTALIERLHFSEYSEKPYRRNGTSFMHMPSPSATAVTVELMGNELEWLILKTNAQVDIQLPAELTHSNNAEISAYFQSPRFHNRRFEAKLKFQNGVWQAPGSVLARTGIIGRDPATGQLALLGVRDAANGVPAFLTQSISSFSFVFKAERLNIARSRPQATLDLASNASNLAGALNFLQSDNRPLFDKFNKCVTEILPTVKWVGVVVPPDDPTSVVIRVWNDVLSEDGTTYGHSLNDCGTGVGQILAILFVVMTSAHGRLIVIDEPNSFLHPTATRALIQTLKRYPRHQYVITTHAPEVIAAAEPELLWLTRWNDNQTTIEIRSGTDIASTRSSLDEVGVKLSDVFGLDRIIWVEGPTEALCFPLIAATNGEDSVDGRLGYIPLLQTGDLEAKKPDAILTWRIYERLAQQSALLPQTVAFSLDNEGRTSKDRAALLERSKSLVHFLPRRTYENFLIHPAALASIMPAAGSKEDIESWIKANGGAKEYLAAEVWVGDLTNPNWLQQVDAAKLLTQLFSELTTTRELYRKTLHSIQLTKWIIANDPDHLSQLRDYIANLRSLESRGISG